MKKTLAVIAIVFCIFGMNIVYATNTVGTTTTTNNSITTTTNTKNNKEKNNVIKDEKKSVTSQLVQIKDNEKSTLEDYQEAYGSETYGLTAYILSKVQLYSIPFCFIGVALSAIYQYVLGIRKLDVRDKGFTIMISIITLFVIAQVLPLVFAIVVKGWRG